MLRLNKLTDYATVILIEMTRHPGEVSSASALAAATRLPEATVGRVLKALARACIVRSVRGAAGGYLLDREPRDISVSEVIAAVEGPVNLVDCVDGATGLCGVENWCVTRGRWDPVNAAIERTLRGISLADMDPNLPCGGKGCAALGA